MGYGYAIFQSYYSSIQTILLMMTIIYSYSTFQSYYSSIQTEFSNRMYESNERLSILLQFDSNSIEHPSTVLLNLPFNPTIVRFKRSPSSSTITSSPIFQSYYSSIQTYFPSNRLGLCSNFQSYYSSIQTRHNHFFN